MNTLRTTYGHEDIEPFYVGGTSATISRSGNFMATAVEEDVTITNLNSDEIIDKIEGDGEVITSLVMTPDGTKLAILSQSQQLRIYDTLSKQIIKSFKMSSPVYISTADSTSSLFAFGGSDGVVTVWDIDGGYVSHSLKGHGTTICALAFHGELNSTEWKLASGDTMGSVRIWDLGKRKCIKAINEHSAAVRGLAFSSSGEQFATGGRDQVVLTFSTKTWKHQSTHPVKEQIENIGYLSIHGKDYLYTAGSTNTLRIWSPKQNGEMILIAETEKPLETNEELLIIDVLKLDQYSPKYLLVISDQTLAEVDLECLFDGDVDLEQQESTTTLPIGRRFAGNHGTIADMVYTGPELLLVALATNSPSLRIVDPINPLQFILCEGHRDLLNVVDSTEDGQWLATGSKDNDIILWHWNGQEETFTIYCTFTGHAGAVTALGLSKVNNGRPDFIISGSSDLTVKKWKIPKTETEIIKVSEYTRRAHEKDINAIDISPNDEYFATASYDKTGKIWDVDTGETIGILKGHKRGLWDINFCQYDKLVVTASGDKSAKLWSLTDFSCKKTFEGHTNAVQRSKFINGNQQLLTTGADGLIKLWDLKVDDDALKTFDNHQNRIWSLDVKKDGETFVTGDADGQITFWEDNSEEERARLEQESKLKIEREQTLNNYVNNKDWSNAFLLALTLNQSMKLYNVIKASIGLNQDSNSILGSIELENTIGKLSQDQLLLLLKKLRDWNVNFKLFEISQKVLMVILFKFEVEKLISIPKFGTLIEAIIPYNERHLNRIDDLIQQSYTLDYVLEEMNKLVV